MQKTESSRPSRIETDANSLPDILVIFYCDGTNVEFANGITLKTRRMLTFDDAAPWARSLYRDFLLAEIPECDLKAIFPPVQSRENEPQAPSGAQGGTQ